MVTRNCNSYSVMLHTQDSPIIFADHNDTEASELPPLCSKMGHLPPLTCLSFMANFSISFFAWSNLLCKEINIVTKKNYEMNFTNTYAMVTPNTEKMYLCP